MVQSLAKGSARSASVGTLRFWHWIALPNALDLMSLLRRTRAFVGVVLPVKLAIDPKNSVHAPPLPFIKRAERRATITHDEFGEPVRLCSLLRESTHWPVVPVHRPYLHTGWPSVRPPPTGTGDVASNLQERAGSDSSSRASCRERVRGRCIGNCSARRGVHS